MKNIAIAYCFIALLSAAFSGFRATPAEAGGGAWTLAGFTKYRDAVFIDRNTISHPSPSTVAVWVKIKPSQKSRLYRALKRELAGDFWHVEILNEIDCAKSSIRSLEIVYYDQEGGVLSSRTQAGAAGKNIAEASLWELVRKAACRKR